MRKYEELFQIGQIAQICGITRKMILNYESLGLVQPVVTDPVSGYRYYDLVTISRITLILDLRSTGMSLPDIGQYLMGKLSAEEQIHRMQIQKQQIEKAIKKLQHLNISEDSMTVETIRLCRQCCIAREMVADTIDAGIGAFTALYGECIDRGLQLDLTAYNFTIYPRDVLADDFFETENIHMIPCIAIKEESLPADAVVYPECDALSVCFRGSLENSVKAYELLKEHILHNHYKVTGYPREFYLEEIMHEESSEYIMQIAIPIQ